MAEEVPRFRTSTIKAILEEGINNQCDKRAKITQSTADLVSEYLRYVVMEATERSLDAAGDDKIISESHLEKILPQLLLDIS